MADENNLELNLSIKFADEKQKADFEAAFYGWVKQYQQIATIQNFVNSQVTDDTRDLFRAYIDFIPGF